MEEEKHDFSSLNKYFKSEDLAKEVESVKVKTITEDVSIGESSFGSFESEEVEVQEINCKVEKEGSASRKEFLKSQEDESLTLDTCAKVNKDWNRG